MNDGVNDKVNDRVNDNPPLALQQRPVEQTAAEQGGSVLYGIWMHQPKAFVLTGDRS